MFGEPVKAGHLGLWKTLSGFRVLGFRILGFGILGFRILGLSILGFREKFRVLGCLPLC